MLEKMSSATSSEKTSSVDLRCFLDRAIFCPLGLACSALEAKKRLGRGGSPSSSVSEQSLCLFVGCKADDAREACARKVFRSTLRTAGRRPWSEKARSGVDLLLLERKGAEFACQELFAFRSRITCWVGDGVREFGSSSASGIRRGVKNELMGLLGFNSEDDPRVWRRLIPRGNLPAANDLISIGSLVVGSRSPQATPAATLGSTSPPINGISSSLIPSSGSVRVTSFLAAGQKTR